MLLLPVAPRNEVSLDGHSSYKNWFTQEPARWFTFRRISFLYHPEVI